MTNKLTVNIPTKNISANWTFYQDEFAALLAEDIQHEIDWEVLSAIMKTAKPETPEWTEIAYSDAAKAAGRTEIKEWCEEKFGNGFFAFNDRIMIAREEDIIMFMLKWS